MRTSEKGLEVIRLYEGCVLKAYKCPAGVWTIGYGHTLGVKVKDKINKVTAEAYLRQDVARVDTQLEQFFPEETLTQGQWDALASLVFNIGWGAFAKSTLLKYIKDGRTDREICSQLLRWHYSGGKSLLGLLKRRIAEANLWMGRTAYELLITKNEKRVIER